MKIEQNDIDLISCRKCAKKFVSSLSLKIHKQASCDSSRTAEFEIKEENIKQEDAVMMQSTKDIKSDAKFSCVQCEKSCEH